MSTYLPEEEVERLAKLPAWERAKVYDIAGIGLMERSQIETEIRARIAEDFREQSLHKRQPPGKRRWHG